MKFALTSLATRPSNTTDYSIGDCVGGTDAIWTFKGLDKNRGAIVTDIALMLRGLTSKPASMGSFTSHFFNAMPSAVADNAAFAATSADYAAYEGSEVLGTPAAVGAGFCWVKVKGLNTSIEPETENSDFFMKLVTDAAWAAPGSGLVMAVRLWLLPKV